MSILFSSIALFQLQKIDELLKMGHTIKVMSRRYRVVFNIIFLLFCITCISQWFYTQREDWPFTYFGMYKKRIYPDNIFSFRITAEKHDGTQIDAYSLGSFNYYSFNDAIESIVRDRVITPENVELSASRQLLLDAERLIRLETLFKRDWNTHLARIKAEDKIRSFRLVVRYWKRFQWEKRNDPDSERVLLSASLENGEWSYTLASLESASTTK